MRRWTVLLLALALVPIWASPAEAAAVTRHVLHTGEALHVGDRLLSSNGRYVAGVDAAGRLSVRTSGGAVRWHTGAVGPHTILYLGLSGLLSLRQAGRVAWSTHTSGSGGADVLTLGNDGTLLVSAAGVPVWSTRLPYGCPTTTAKVIYVDISRQWARMCRNRQQIRATFVTTGASAFGNGTPTGTWHVYAKSRNTTLYPAAGGAYPVKYWMPYSGPYGLHDSSWQHFPYGSSAYRTRGSHGCIHVPLAAMTWLFGWAGVGTQVTIHT